MDFLDRVFIAILFVYLVCMGSKTDNLEISVEEDKVLI